MNQPPPREPVICPLHNDVFDPPMAYIQTWEGRDFYECPAARCSCAINYPAAGTDPELTPPCTASPPMMS